MDSQDPDRIEQIPPTDDSSAIEQVAPTSESSAVEQVAPTGESSAVEQVPSNGDILAAIWQRRGFKVLQNVDNPALYNIDWSDPQSAFDKSHIPTGYLPGTPRGPYFRSRRIIKGEADLSFLKKRTKTTRFYISNGIVYLCMVIGCVLAAILVWDGYRKVPQHKYCKVFHDNFTTWDPSVWTKEVEVGGFGYGQFEMTTNTDENVFIKDNHLVIKPTLQDESFIGTNYTIDLRDKGCTGFEWYDCVAHTNTTNSTIVNPVKSGRINSKLGPSIKYGRVEVVAKLPAGDWLWPAIRMLPKDNVYGPWPCSGEIDIAQSRGNAPGYPQGGSDIASSTLHFGPDLNNDGWWRYNVKRKALHTTYAADYNKFGLEWNEKYIFTYINERLDQVMYTDLDKPFFEYGRFPLAYDNGSRVENPWKHTNSNASPFDQEFYLALSLAVGSTNGWFEDGVSGKPWIDRSPRAKLDFWEAKDYWLPTWKDGGEMHIKSVTMWQETGYNGCNHK